MYINDGDRVVLVDADSPELKRFIGAEGLVQAAWYTYHPAYAQVLFKPNFQCDVYVSYLEVLPPLESPFSYKETVRVTSTFVAKRCNKKLVGKVGQIRGYDKRNQNYLIKSSDNIQGWFPANCLFPITYKGKHFHYPLDMVIFKGSRKMVDQVKRTKNNYGQLLLLDGDWVPASDVSPDKKN
jgi:hypothetical protein